MHGVAAGRAMAADAAADSDEVIVAAHADDDGAR